MGNKEIQGNGRLTRAIETFERDDYRVVEGFPLNNEGQAVCPRCNAEECMQIGRATVIQYSYFLSGDDRSLDKYKYYVRCSACALLYVWEDKVLS